jgi:hypothetical protein
MKRGKSTFLNALRARLSDPEADLADVGFSEFLKVLERFLSRDRAAIEWESATASARGACERFKDAIERRIPLLDRTVEELKPKIEAAQSDFDKLAEIGYRFQLEIRNAGTQQAQELADSFKEYIVTYPPINRGLSVALHFSPRIRTILCALTG